MKKNHLNFRDIMTQPLYYLPLLFDDYEIITIIENDKKGKSTDYIIGKGCASSGFNEVDEALKKGSDISFFNTYEYFVENYRVIENADFLQAVLTASAELYEIEKTASFSFGEKEKDIVLRLCKKYGLNDDELLEISDNKNNIPQDSHGCYLFSVIHQLKDFYRTYMAYYELLFNDNDTEENIEAIADCDINIEVRSLYSKNNRKIELVFVAQSLLDVAKFQLIHVMGDKEYIKKCANPKCNNFIICERSTKKTCSDACRKAYERQLKRGVIHNGNDKEDK